eukprot:TRINITY_DN5436_c0_g1_i1.p1 TRINITY_DN5436_c0_g1~~TRINITY_DN5436_c0_g1_i1.p1  ORF type:complete len:197 (-),score=34.03 TRINITY_DN5436_c0_g1_i1:109-666(-)
MNIVPIPLNRCSVNETFSPQMPMALNGKLTPQQYGATIDVINREFSPHQKLTYAVVGIMLLFMIPFGFLPILIQDNFNAFYPVLISCTIVYCAAVIILAVRRHQLHTRLLHILAAENIAFSSSGVSIVYQRPLCLGSPLNLHIFNVQQQQPQYSDSYQQPLMTGQTPGGYDNVVPVYQNAPVKQV